jgi:hypothetical protein
MNWVPPKQPPWVREAPPTVGQSPSSTFASLSIKSQNTSQQTKNESVAYLARVGRTSKLRVSLDVLAPKVDLPTGSFHPFPLGKTPRLHGTKPSWVAQDPTLPANIVASQSFPKVSDPKLSVPSKQVVHADSVDSDDLYGTARPVQPGLINAYDRVEEWRISSSGNPELAITLEKNWEPPPAILERRCRPSTFDHRHSLPPLELTPKSLVEVEKVKESQLHPAEKPPLTAAPSTDSKPPISFAERRATPAVLASGDLLISTDLTPAALVTEEICVCGETITDEDSSILAELNDYFVQSGFGDATVEYKCLSDNGTEIDSELDKTEFEFQALQPFPENADDVEIASVDNQDECGSDEVGAKEFLQSLDDLMVKMVTANETSFESFSAKSDFETHERNEPDTQHLTHIEHTCEKDYDSRSSQELYSFLEHRARLESCTSIESTPAFTMSPTPTASKLITELLSNSDPFSKVVTHVSVGLGETAAGTDTGLDNTEHESNAGLREFLLKSGLF